MSRTDKKTNLPQAQDLLSLPDTRVIQEKMARKFGSLPMRILIVFDGRNDRDMDSVLVDLSNRFHLRGHEVINIIAGRTGAFPSTQDFIVPPLPDLRTRTAVGLSHKLKKLIDEYQPTMIIAGSSFTRHPAVVSAEASRRRPRIVLYKNEGLSELPLAARFNATIVLPMADLIIATSKTAKEDILHYSSEMRIKTHAIHAPLIGQDLKSRSGVHIHHHWFENPTAPIFIMNEVLTGSKNQMNVINRIAEMAREFPTRLMIFGKGPGRKALQRRIEKLDIPHLVIIQESFEDISPYVARANGFLRADPSTSIPRSMVEAMSVGCPVISFIHDDAISEALPTEECGRRIERTEPEQLSLALQEAIKISRRTPSASLDRFEHDKIIDAHVNACLSVRFLKRKKQTMRIGFKKPKTMALPSK
jgi:glycosyltransferase involved in cell wall biosynthesis